MLSAPSEADHAAAFRANAVGTFNVLEAARTHGVSAGALRQHDQHLRTRPARGRRRRLHAAAAGDVLRDDQAVRRAHGPLLQAQVRPRLPRDQVPLHRRARRDDARHIPVHVPRHRGEREGRALHHIRRAPHQGAHHLHPRGRRGDRQASCRPRRPHPDRRLPARRHHPNTHRPTTRRRHPHPPTQRQRSTSTPTPPSKPSTTPAAP